VELPVYYAWSKQLKLTTKDNLVVKTKISVEMEDFLLHYKFIFHSF